MMWRKNLRKLKAKSFAGLALIALGLGGCSMAMPWEWDGTLPWQGDMPANYQSRHPILLTTGTESTTLNVGIAGGGLNPIQRTQIESFARAFRLDGEGAIAVSIPAGAPNEGQAAHIAQQVRSIIHGQGVPLQAIVYRPYTAGPGAMAPPLLLSYRRVRATVGNSCGVIEDTRISYTNLPYQDFGCATQTNFAAMLADPNDLVGPRPLDNASAARRATVLDGYTKGSKTSTGPLAGGSSTSGSSGGSGSSSSSGSGS